MNYKLMLTLVTILLVGMPRHCAVAADTPASPVPDGQVLLNGEWEFSQDRKSYEKTIVPGMQLSGGSVAPGTLWYRRDITLPGGDWSRAVLVLKGARFAPAVHVNGQLVSSVNGGMSPTIHLLKHPAVKPGAKVQLEIALTSQKDLALTDASRVPEADIWRTDNASHFWDDLVLETHGDTRIVRVLPFTDFAGRSVRARWEMQKLAEQASPPQGITCRLYDADGKVVAEAEGTGGAWSGDITLKWPDNCRAWSPEDPYCHRLELTAKVGQRVERHTQTYGFKELKVKGSVLELNGRPYQLRGGNVAFWRVLRDDDAAVPCFDRDWYERNILLRYKQSGANYLRFHLGGPFEWILDWCDRNGLIVQREWPFFHGIGKVTGASMLEQWPTWMDANTAHPSVGLIQLANEGGDRECRGVFKAMERQYPSILVAERDTRHLHDYQWSLFENLKLSADSMEGKTVIVDEYAGLFLDGDSAATPYNRGVYFERFLGRGHSAEQRLEFQAMVAGRLSEYWRRIKAPGFAPFVALDAANDGGHWFLGPLKDGRPKPIWSALPVAFSARAASLEVWDRNYTPGQRAQWPLWMFNDTDTEAELKAVVGIRDLNDQPAGKETTVIQKVPAWRRKIVPVDFEVPSAKGIYRFVARRTCWRWINNRRYG